MKIKGRVVDINLKEIYDAVVEVEDGRIVSIYQDEDDFEEGGYILPGFVDAHVHIESSMLTPCEFGRMVAGRGTVAVVNDPHEIANVMGCEGVEFMLESAESAPIKIYSTLPSSVPATPFDSSGGEITAEDVERLIDSGHFVGLSEVMNVPGVLSGVEDVMRKIEATQRAMLPIDGHAPALRGEDLGRYIESGVSTDHESFTLDEAREKLERGMKVIIREGSAARNFEALKPLITEWSDMLMFCTDDAHPDDIVERGHIDSLVRRAVAEGYDLFDVLKIASRNAVEHYSLDVGQLRVGDRADFIVVEDLVDFELRESYIEGVRWQDEEPSGEGASVINCFDHDPIGAGSLRRGVTPETPIMELVEGELITREGCFGGELSLENLEGDREIQKLVYINRYHNGEPQVAYCRGFGLRRGAVASSVAHDSHNIIAVGCDDRSLCEAINAVIEERGALCVVDGGAGSVETLPLPIGGIMSTARYEDVAKAYRSLSDRVRTMGTPLKSPFMTLSFLSLVVIPELKIGEQGLFSFSKFGWVEEA